MIKLYRFTAGLLIFLCFQFVTTCSNAQTPGANAASALGNANAKNQRLTTIGKQATLPNNSGRLYESLSLRAASRYPAPRRENSMMPVQIAPSNFTGTGLLSGCAWVASTVIPIPIMDNPMVTVGGNMYSFAGVSNNAIVANSYKFDGTVWTAIAALPVALEYPSAVTDGSNIFIVDGTSATANVNTVYRYNIATNTYTTMAPTTTATWSHASAFLNGKIYKFGGLDNAGNPVTALEIYDVATNTWTTGAAYPTALGFVSCFVQGNFIYGCGGTTATTGSAKTYRYDPATNTWNDAAIADLPATRWGAASSFYNGEGILAGGYVAGDLAANTSTSAVSWDPALNTWSSVTNMLVERNRMNGAVLAGSFYVTGGRSLAQANTFVGTNNNQKLTCTAATGADLAITKTDGVTSYTAGDTLTYTIVASNSGPDPAPGTVVTDNFPAAVTSAAWTVVYAGGATGPASGSNNISATVSLPAGSSATFTLTCNISAAATGTLSNTATVAAGTGVTDPTAANNTATDTDTQASGCDWTASTVYPIVTMDAPTAAVGNTLYVFSGVSNSALTANSYKFNGTTWTAIAALPVALEFASAVSDGTNIYIMGGTTGTSVKTNYRYNVATNTYTTLAQMTTGVWNHSAQYLNGKIYKFCGTATVATNVMEIYDIASNTWSAGANYPLSLSFVNSFVQGNFIYACGGVDATPTATNKTYRYDPATNTWNDAAIADLPATRWAAANGFYNGKGILAGGYVAGVAAANVSTSAIAWDLASNTWLTLPSMLTDRARMTGAVLPNSFYVIGGRPASQGNTFVGTNDNQKYTSAGGTINYGGSPYCQNAGAATVTQTGTTGGTFTSTAGLTISGATGTVTLGTSTPGTYTVTYTIAASGPCPFFSTTATIVITATPAAAISYAGSPYCQNAGTAIVTQTGTTGGTYSSTAGLTINSAGTIALASSTPGTYTVTYTVAAAGGCAAFTTTAPVTITTAPSGTITYSGTPYCTTAGTATVTQTGTAGGTYSSTPGLSIAAATGDVTLSTSAPGTYTVTYTVAAANGCAAYSTTTAITVNNCSSSCVENFDTVTVPALPAGWSATTGATCVNSTAWQTVNTTSSSAPNSASTNDPNCVSDEYLNSKTYTIAAAASQLMFKNNYNLETNFDGMVLEISVNGGAFTDIITAGGTFAGGSYNGTISTITGSPIPGRAAWTGNSGGFITTTVNLPLAAQGQNVIFRWRRATDLSQAGVGAFIDDVTITPSPSAFAAISYAGSPYCSNGGTATVTQTGTTSGTYSSTAGLSINTASGDITLGTSTPGTYTVTYSNSGGCSVFSTTASVTITAAPSATISYAGSPYCQNSGTASVTQTGTGGGTYSSTAGLSIAPGSGAVTLATSTPGPYTVTYIVAAAGGCAAFSTTASITITATPNATISYAGNPYCQNAGNATVTQTGTAGGTYSSTAGLSIAPGSGTVTLSTSTAGTYTVTYTVAAAGGCAAYTTTTTITVTALPTGTIAYTGSPYCQNAGSATVTQTGTGVGTYSSTAGLSIAPGSGTVTLGTSTPGTYTVTYTVAAAGGCAAFSTTASITITATPNATISYAGNPYCQNAGNATVMQTGTAGGTYSSTAGLSIAPGSGTVTLGTSAAGTYTVTYTVSAAGGCAAYTTTTTITITAPPTGTIAYTGSPYCSSAGTATVTQTGTAGGTYSSTAGLSLAAGSGTVTLGTSTPGTYTVTYTIAAAGGCAVFTTTATITVTAAPNATISYTGSPYCNNGGTATVTQTGTGGGTYSSTTGLSITPATGALNLNTSTGGTYTVTYSIAASGGCAAFTTTASVTINTVSIAPTGATATPSILCGAGTTNLSVTGGTLGTGGSYKWYTGSCGGTLIGTGATLTGIAVASTTTFYVRAEGVCGNTACASVTVTVSPVPVVVLAAAGSTNPTATNPAHPTGLYATVSPPGNYIFSWTLNGLILPVLGSSITPANGIFNDFGTYVVKAIDVNTGCIGTSNSITITDVVPERDVLFISPNPTRDLINISFFSNTVVAQARTVAVYDGTGQRVMLRGFAPVGTYGKMTLDLTRLVSGVYLVVLMDASNKKIASGKVIKK